MDLWDPAAFLESLERPVCWEGLPICVTLEYTTRMLSLQFLVLWCANSLLPFSTTVPNAIWTSSGIYSLGLRPASSGIDLEAERWQCFPRPPPPLVPHTGTKHLLGSVLAGKGSGSSFLSFWSLIMQAWTRFAGETATITTHVNSCGRWFSSRHYRKALSVTQKQPSGWTRTQTFASRNFKNEKFPIGIYLY